MEASIDSLHSTFTRTALLSSDLVDSVLQSFAALDLLRETSPQFEGLVSRGVALTPDFYGQVRDMLACEAVTQRFRELFIDHFKRGGVAAWVNQGVAALSETVRATDRFDFVDNS
jgi:hypothetical protein